MSSLGLIVRFTVKVSAGKKPRIGRGLQAVASIQEHENKVKFNMVALVRYFQLQHILVL